MKRILQMVPKWTIAGLLLFTSVQAQGAFFDQCCGNDNSCCADSCGNNFWANAEYLYWKIQDSPEHVPLVIDETSDTVVLGGKKVSSKWRSGGRFTLGYWFDDATASASKLTTSSFQKKREKTMCSQMGPLVQMLLAVPFYNVATSRRLFIRHCQPWFILGLCGLESEQQNARSRIESTRRSV